MPRLTDLSPGTDEHERLPLTARDSYDIAGKFAQGGIGRILRAHDPVLGRTVALKELLVAGHRTDERRFVREVLLTARLQHPGIVPVYAAGRWPSGEPFYAMKLVSGRSFDRVIAEADLDTLIPMPTTPWAPEREWLSIRTLVVNKLRETAHHCGHADIIREALDGQTTMAAISEGQPWADEDWI